MPIKGPLVGYTNIADIINNVVPFVMTLAGILLFFVLMWGGFDYATSQGQPEKLKSANAKITAGVIGHRAGVPGARGRRRQKRFSFRDGHQGPPQNQASEPLSGAAAERRLHAARICGARFTGRFQQVPRRRIPDHDARSPKGRR